MPRVLRCGDDAGVLGFGTLAVIVLAGLLGPALSSSKRWFVPVVGGEILGGIVVGPHSLDLVHPGVPALSFLGEVGFAMLMLTVGMHLPLRDRRLGGSLRAGVLLAAAVGLMSVPAGLLAAQLAGGGHAAVYAAVLASGSAAVLLPAVEEAGLGGSVALRVMAQVMVADVVTIVSIPIVLQPHRVTHALLGAVLVALAAALALGLARAAAGRSLTQAARHRSKRRHWALDLRLALLVLFVLGWIAQEGGTSTLVAGFGAGVTIAILGGPKRLSTQVRGVADGFFIPLYFVLLGARLDVGGLFSHPELLALAAALTALSVGVRLLASTVAKMPPSAALAASAQLGVPVAVASLGLSEHVLSAGTATGIVAASLCSLAVASLGVDALVRRERATAAPGDGAGARAPA